MLREMTFIVVSLGSVALVSAADSPKAGLWAIHANTQNVCEKGDSLQSLKGKRVRFTDADHRQLRWLRHDP